MSLADDVAELVQNHDRFYGSVAGVTTSDSRGAQWVDLSKEPFGFMAHDLAQEMGVIITRVDSGINEDTTRFWFARVEIVEEPQLKVQ